MRDKKQRRTRNRALTALLLPAIILMWIVGWAFYWIGHQKEPKPKTRPAAKENNILLIPAFQVKEETLEATA